MSLLVHASRSAIHDVARIGKLYARPQIVDEITTTATAVLGAGTDSVA